jgi:hypothetical protein
MAKIDIITLTGFTAIDGSIVTSGATIKFNSEFLAGTNIIVIKPKLYRSRELFEMGYEEVHINGIPNVFRLELPDEEFYVLTPAILYEKVRDYLNNLMGVIMFEIKIIL